MISDLQQNLQNKSKLETDIISMSRQVSLTNNCTKTTLPNNINPQNLQFPKSLSAAMP